MPRDYLWTFTEEVGSIDKRWDLAQDGYKRTTKEAIMPSALAELKRRKETDRRLSFGLYLVFLVIIIAVSIVFGALGTWVGGFGAGRIVSLIICLGVAIYVWWYNWLLYKRRNEHFERTKNLRKILSDLLEEKRGTEKGPLTQMDPLIQRREIQRPYYLFWLWLVCSYVGSLSSFLPVTWVLTIAAVIIGLVIVYYLTVDYYYHEQGEIAFLGKVSVALGKNGSSLTVNPTSPLHRRSYGLYILFTIITLGIFGIYWAYVLFHDPNKHFDTHEVWERELERIVDKELA